MTSVTVPLCTSIPSSHRRLADAHLHLSTAPLPPPNQHCPLYHPFCWFELEPDHVSGSKRPALHGRAFCRTRGLHRQQASSSMAMVLPAAASRLPTSLPNLFQFILPLCIIPTPTAVLHNDVTPDPPHPGHQRLCYKRLVRHRAQAGGQGRDRCGGAGGWARPHHPRCLKASRAPGKNPASCSRAAQLIFRSSTCSIKHR